MLTVFLGEIEDAEALRLRNSIIESTTRIEDLEEKVKVSSPRGTTYLSGFLSVGKNECWCPL